MGSHCIAVHTHQNSSIGIPSSQEIRMRLVILFFIFGLCSTAVVKKNLCSDGCCGTGMHTPDENGSYTGSHHLYTIYDPRDDSPEDWDYWHLICRTTPGPSGLPGKLLVLESRTELDCLIEFINDEFDDPAKLSKYAVGLKGKTTQNKGIFKWQNVDTSSNFDAATPSWSNWKGGAIPATANAPCVYMEIGQTAAVNGLWSLANCNVVTMLGICEFE